MNKFIILVTLFLSSCVTYSSGEVPSVSLDYETTRNEIKEKKDVTFSVSFDESIGKNVNKYEKKLANSIKEYLKESKFFDKVYYTTNQGDLHYHFEGHFAGTDPQTRYGMGLLLGYTLFLIPMEESYDVDVTMHVFRKGKEVYAITAPNRVNRLYWLPFIVTWPFANYITVGNYVIRKDMRYFMSEIIENKLYE
ncbi:MAG: hypothetical protein J6K16_04355 [Alphaproteobacteria bacterium]|nr:hypothetical protein [Alphaproteobacteria bacterium]